MVWLIFLKGEGLGTQPCLYLSDRCVWGGWYRWVISVHGGVEDSSTSYLDVSVTPQAPFPAVTSVLSFTLISMCMSRRHCLHTQVKPDFNTGCVILKGFTWGGDELSFLTAAQVQTRGGLTSVKEWVPFFFFFFLGLQLY